MSEFPFFKQLDSMDCGPSCLRMISKYYGKSYSIQSLRNKAYITKSGVSMPGISEAAEIIGFRTRGNRLTWEQGAGRREFMPFLTPEVSTSNSPGHAPGQRQ
jgi:ATP-binding cassette subfamily B protein